MQSIHYLFYIYRCVLSAMTSSTSPPTTISTTQAPPPPPTCIQAGDTCSAAPDTCCGDNSACLETFSGSGTSVCTACIKEGEKCEAATATNCCAGPSFCSKTAAGLSSFQCSATECLQANTICRNDDDCCSKDCADPISPSTDKKCGA